MRIFFFGNGDNYLRKLLSEENNVLGVMAEEREPELEHYFGSVVKTAKKNNVPVWKTEKFLSKNGWRKF